MNDGAVDIILILRNAFEARRAVKPTLSFREFAFQLGFDVGTLHHIMSGKRKVGSRRARKILSALQYHPSEIDGLVLKIKR